MPNIIGLSYEAPNFFDNSDRFAWMPKDEFRRITGSESFEAYHASKNRYYASIIANAKNNKSIQQVDYDFNYDVSKANVVDNSNAWRTASDLVKGRKQGTIISFDTETIGNFSGSLKDAETAIAGITEIGLKTQSFGIDAYKDLPDASFIFGIDSKQASWLRATLNKKVKGEQLSSTEASALERMSRYSTLGENGFIYQTQNVNGVDYIVSNRINVSRPDSIDDIVNGIETLEKIYSINGNRDAKISNVINRLNQLASEQNSVLSGHNLNYDFNAINTYSRMHGTTALGNFEYVDTLHAIRAYAQENNITTGEFLKRIFGDSFSSEKYGSLEALTDAIEEATDYSIAQAHNAYNDSLKQLSVLVNQNLDIIGKSVGIINNSSNGMELRTLDNSYVRINSKGNIRQTDVLTYDGTVTGSYSPNNRYWNFVEAKQGHVADFVDKFEGSDKEYVLKEGGDKFIARFTDANDPHAELIKVFDREEQFSDFLSKNTTFVRKSEADLEYMQRLNNLDTARRVIDGYAQPSAVSIIKQSNNRIKDVGGYSGFSTNYKVYNAIRNMSQSEIDSLGFESVSGSPIKTYQDVINNLSYKDNVAKLIAYGDANKVEDITGIFRSTKQLSSASPKVASDSYYSQRIILGESLKTFEQNKEFYDYAFGQLESKDWTNLQKTIAFRKIQEEYIKSGFSNVGVNTHGYTSQDFDNISILRPDGSGYSNLSLSENIASSRLLRIASDGSSNQRIQSDNLLGIANDLQKRGLLTAEQVIEINKFNNGKNAYAMSEAIVSSLNASGKDITLDDYLRVMDMHQNDYSVSSIAESFVAQGMSESDAKNYVRRIINRNNKPLEESAESVMSRTFSTGAFTSEFIDSMNKAIDDVNNGISLFGYGIENETINGEIRAKVKALGYSDDSVNNLLRHYWSLSSEGFKSNTNGGNIHVINKQLESLGMEEVFPIFYKNNNANTSAFMLHTTQRNYAKVIDALSQLDPNLDNSQIKSQLENLDASFFEIYQLEKHSIDIGSKQDEILKTLTTKTFTDSSNKEHVIEGHGAEVTLVRQGDNYFKYDTTKINMYRDKSGKIRAYASSGGDEFLDSLRLNYRRTIELTSRGEFKQATRIANSNNIAMLQENAAPAFTGNPDGLGSIVRSHMINDNDLLTASTIIFDNNVDRGNLNLTDVVREIVSSNKYQRTTDSAKDAYEALYAITRNLDDTYQITGRHKNYGIREIDAVLRSEQGKTLFGELYSKKAGGIGAHDIVKDMMANGYNKESIIKVKDKSILQLIADASQNREEFDESFTKLFAYLAEEDEALNIDPVNKMSAIEKQGFLLNSIAANDNYRGSITTRPTYSQRANYRPYRLTEDWFHDYKKLESELGIHFGEVYIPEEYAKRIVSLNKSVLEKEGKELTRESMTYGRIIGAVQSKSQYEIKASRERNIEWLKRQAKAQGLDEDALVRFYDKMASDINTYEGKAYLNPVLFNQPHFRYGDPKTIKSKDIRNVYALGNIIEQKHTDDILQNLVGKRIKSGTVIGMRYNEKGALENILYNGPTIASLTEENISDLKNKGITQAVTEQQVQSVKIMFGQEKATAYSLAYYKSVSEQGQIDDMLSLLEEYGIKTTSRDAKELHGLLDTYAGLAYSAISSENATGKSIMAYVNNNILKHGTDEAYSSIENIIFSQFGSKEGFDELKNIARDISWNNKKLTDHWSYDELSGIRHNNPLENGREAVTEELVSALRDASAISENARKAIETIDFMANHNMSYSSIQRQIMTTYQGDEFIFGPRALQVLTLQGEGNFMIKGNGSGGELANIILDNLDNDIYEKAYGLGKYKAIDNVRSSVLRKQRGTLHTKYVDDMLAGIYESLGFYDNNLTEQSIQNKNIIKIKSSDILDEIVPSGGDANIYKNFIFKENGEFSSFIKNRANGVDLDAASNVFYLDLTDMGGMKLVMNKEQITLNGILIPFQNIDSNADNVYVAQSTAKVVSFFNALKKQNNEEISKALNEMLSAFRKELDPKSKDSLVTKSTLKKSIPGTSYGLALDAITPTFEDVNGVFELKDFDRIRELERDISSAVGSYEGFADEDTQNKIRELNDLYLRRKEAIRIQQRQIREAINPVDKLNFGTGSNEIYRKYITGPKVNGKNVIENVVVVGEDMFNEADMNLGHIGHQVVTDYFSGKDLSGLTKYDNFSKITGDKFRINYFTESEIINGVTVKTKGISETLNDILSSFKNSEMHKDWSLDTRKALDAILASTEFKSEPQRMNALIGTFNASVNKHIKEEISFGVGLSNNALNTSKARLLTQAEREAFLNQIESGFEDIGKRYAREVGVLGLVGRNPLFYEGSILPVRIFFDEAIQGKEIRFLGPQFSILQNLDFDGDTEFIKFLGNGGLAAKKDAEAIALKKHFDYMNRDNVERFVQSLEKSFDSYKLTDTKSFNYALLKEVSPDIFKSAKEEFLSSLTDEARREFENSYTSNVQDVILANSKQFKKAFREYDMISGTAITNAKMVQASMQAVIAKEFIGNFSKPNIEIRDTLMNMLSLVEEGSDAEKELIAIRNSLINLTDVDTKTITSGSVKGVNPGGILTILEQKGIDTKHIHDASLLNESTAWRLGVMQLFEQANGHGELRVDADSLREQAIQKLVAGAKKVYFSDVEDTNALVKEILNNITSGSDYRSAYESEIASYIETIAKANSSNANAELIKAAKDAEDALNVVYGKLGITDIAKLSTMDNAYDSFYGTGIAQKYKQTSEGIKLLTDDEIQDIIINENNGRYRNINQIQSIGIAKALEKNATDEALNVNGRLLNVGQDVLIAQDEKLGAIGLLVEDKKYSGGQFELTLRKFDIFADDLIHDGKISESAYLDTKTTETLKGISIKDLNEQLKRQYADKKLLDVRRTDGRDKNITVTYLGNLLNDEAETELLRREIATASFAKKLDTLIDIEDTDAFGKAFEKILKLEDRVIKEYDESFGTTTLLKNITGENPIIFKHKVDALKEYITFGIQTHRIGGSEDAKDLMRSINRAIAENPRESINRFAGSDIESLVFNYIDNNAKIYDTDFLRKGIDIIKLTNEMTVNIEGFIDTRDKDILNIASEFYSGYVAQSAPESELFSNAINSYNSIVRANTAKVFDEFRRFGDSDKTIEAMFNVFGWNDFLSEASDNYFINVTDSAKIKTGGKLFTPLINAKVGYGSFLGTSLDDLHVNQKEFILREIEEALPNLDESSIEYIAAKNTQTLINLKKSYDPHVKGLDFTNAKTLAASYKAIASPEMFQESADSFRKATQEAAEESVKKTISGELKNKVTGMTSEQKGALKLGGLVLAGIAGAGIIGHALFNSDDTDNDYEVDSTPEYDTKIKGLEGKSETSYRSKSSAKQALKQHKKAAPKSSIFDRNIYHDAASGFDFKVSAASKKKLESNAYNKFSNLVGAKGSTLSISKDNSRITDNWLENKFSQLME